MFYNMCYAVKFITKFFVFYLERYFVAVYKWQIYFINIRMYFCRNNVAGT